MSADYSGTENTMGTKEDMRLLLDYMEAAEKLSVGRTTIYSLTERGELKTVKIGRRALITADSLDAYVQRLTEAGDTAVAI